MFCFFIDFLRLYPYSVLVEVCPNLNKGIVNPKPISAPISPSKPKRLRHLP